MINSKIGTSTTDAAVTVTITRPAFKRGWIMIKSITVTTKGADIAKDTDIVLNDNGVAVWAAVLRSGKVYGGHFQDLHIPIKNGDATVVVDAAGASVVAIASVVYETL